MNKEYRAVAEFCKKSKLPTLQNVQRITELGAGASHGNYLIQTEKEKLVLRKDIDTTSKHKLKKEYEVLQAIKTLGIAPKPLHFQKKSSIGEFMLLEYIEGTSLNKTPYSLSQYFLKQLAYEVAQLHKTQTKALKAKLPLGSNPPALFLKELQGYRKQLKPYIQSEDFYKIMDEVYEKFERITKQQDFIHPMCLIHRDIQEQNIIVHNKKLKLIDWESSGISDPATEVAYILTQFGRPFSPQEKEYFITQYLKYRKDSSLRERADYYIPLILWIDFLWSNLHTAKIQKGLLQYSNKHQKVGSQKEYTREALQRVLDVNLITKTQASFLKALVN